MKNQREKILRYNSQEELFYALIRKHPVPDGGLPAQERTTGITKAKKRLAAAIHMFIS